MNHKGVEYTLATIEPGIWKWEFRIDQKVMAGRIRTNLKGLAQRRVETKIDLYLKQAARAIGQRA
jgi:hypothetical protein